MKTKEIARILTTITDEQWEAILIASKKAINLPVAQGGVKANSGGKNKAEVEKGENELRLKILNLVKEIGVPPHILGYSYLQDAVMLAYKDETYIHNVVKRLYPDIAEMYGTKGSRVERAIRHALEFVDNTGDENLNEIFNTTKHLTNTQAIAALVEYIKTYD